MYQLLICFLLLQSAIHLELKAQPKEEQAKMRKESIKTVSVFSVPIKDGQIVEGADKILYRYSYSREGAYSEKAEFNADGKQYRQVKYHYDAAKRTNEETVIILDQGIISKTVTKHDLNYTPTEIIEYDGKGQILEKNLLKYDKGNLIEKTRLNPAGATTGRIEIKYSPFNKPTEEIEYDSLGNIRSKTVYTYDKTNHLIQKVIYDGKNNVDTKWIYDYNNVGLVGTMTLYEGTGRVLSKYTYAYDIAGLLVDETMYDDKDRPVKALKHMYEKWFDRR